MEPGGDSRLLLARLLYTLLDLSVFTLAFLAVFAALAMLRARQIA